MALTDAPWSEKNPVQPRALTVWVLRVQTLLTDTFKHVSVVIYLIYFLKFFYLRNLSTITKVEQAD